MIHVVLTAVSIGVILSILLTAFVWRRCCYGRQRKNFVDGSPDHHQSLQAGIVQLHHESLHHNRLDSFDAKRRGNNNYYVFRRGVVSSKPLFNWADHPSLITDAVENGWSRFGFTNYTSSPSSARSSLLSGFCAVGDYGRETQTDITWEVCQGSADFMQKIRLNSGLKKSNTNNNNNNNNNTSMLSAASVIRTALPLPGPPLNNSAFPQEAYFEITVLYSHYDRHQSIGGKSNDGEKTKLIPENSNANANSESLVHVTSNHRIIKINEELKLASTKDDVNDELVMLSVGLSAGGSLPLILPGSYLGSIGFNSNGSVYLDGTKLVFESEKTEWGRADKVIGCGFDPRQKKVFFTIDSELVHVIHCKSEEFGTPLYPTLAANCDVLVLVNFGQSAFAYAAANAQRTSNPCFIGPLVNSPAAALGYEDSKELFSMGRIDSEWLNRSSTKGGNRTSEFDEESEADLFEIVLDTSGRSPNTVL